MGVGHRRLRQRPRHRARAARAGVRALLPRPGSCCSRHRPRACDRPRAGRAHGGPAARHERPRRHPLHARAARTDRRAHPRLHWASVSTRAALASAVVIALVAGIAGGALALALRGGGGGRTTVTTVVRGGDSGRAGAFDPVELYADSRDGIVTIEATFGVDDQTGGSG